MPHRLASHLWMALLVLSLLSITGPWLKLPEKLTSANTAKFSYELQKAIEDWNAVAHETDDESPIIDLVVTLRNSVTEADLAELRSSASSTAVQGAFGRLVHLQIALDQVEGIAALGQVVSIAFPAAPIEN
jgi:hypothetical protein